MALHERLPIEDMEFVMKTLGQPRDVVNRFLDFGVPADGIPMVIDALEKLSTEYADPRDRNAPSTLVQVEIASVAEAYHVCRGNEEDFARIIEFADQILTENLVDSIKITQHRTVQGYNDAVFAAIEAYKSNTIDD